MISILLILKKEKYYFNIINPLFFSSLLIFFFIYQKKYYVKTAKNHRLNIFIFTIACFYNLIYFYLGIIFGFVNNPYQHKILTIIKNIFTQIIPLLGIEKVRSILTYNNKKNTKVLLASFILLFLLEINFKTIYFLADNKEILFQYICSHILPLIANGLLYTYLSSKGSHPVILRILNKGMILLLPILPNLDWFCSGTFYLIMSLLIYILYNYFFIKEKKQKKSFIKNSYTITFFLSIVLICFMLGFFKYEIITILSNSMKPIFNKGDAVIYVKYNKERLQNLDNKTIIIYKTANKNIVHRIVNKIEKNNEIFYQTKGDNNTTNDKNLVNVNQIKGVYVFHIKYLGYPTMWLYNYFHNKN